MVLDVHSQRAREFVAQRNGLSLLMLLFHVLFVLGCSSFLHTPPALGQHSVAAQPRCLPREAPGLRCTHAGPSP